jgi:hypothetical protein
MALSQTSGEPETISLIALADRFIEAHRTMSNRAFAGVAPAEWCGTAIAAANL